MTRLQTLFFFVFSSVALFAAAPPSIDTTGPETVQITLDADKKSVPEGGIVTFSITATGGTPPYTYYWWLEGDPNWTITPINSYPRPLFGVGQKTLYATVRDNGGGISPTDEVTVSITAQTPTAPLPPAPVSQ